VAKGGEDEPHCSHLQKGTIKWPPRPLYVSRNTCRLNHILAGAATTIWPLVPDPPQETDPLGPRLAAGYNHNRAESAESEA
jgi:hypothetical protein